MEAEGWPVLHGFSPVVVPPPADWPAYRPVTGYWWPPAGGVLSPGLQRFLDDGERPVFIGFGSMSAPGLASWSSPPSPGSGGGPSCSGAAGLAPDHRDVLVVDDEPHQALFPA